MTFTNSSQRARLHNHLEEQLFNLIKHCRTYVMPILWHFMKGLIHENQCLRWKLARTDEKNIVSLQLYWEIKLDKINADGNN